MARRTKHTMPFEVERGTATVEYLVEFEVSPEEPMRGPSMTSPGEPGYPPEVESKTVYFVGKKTCPGCKGTGLDFDLSLAGAPTTRICPKCHGAKRVTFREERPELEDMVDDDELLEHANANAGWDGPDTIEEWRGER